MPFVREIARGHGVRKMVVFSVADQYTVKTSRPLFCDAEVHAWVGLLPLSAFLDV